MVTPGQIEIALHKWNLWNESIALARREVGFRAGFAENELAKWEEDGGWQRAWDLAERVLKDLVLPASFATYWMACFSSDYDATKPATYGRIRLPQRAKAIAHYEREPGAFLVQSVGTKAYKLNGRGNVSIDTSDPERTLPPYPVEVLFPALVPFTVGVLGGPGGASEVIPIIDIPFTKKLVFSAAPGTAPSPYVTIRLPLFASNPDWTWFRMQLDAIEKWLKAIGEHPLAIALKGGRRDRFYWKEQAVEKLASAQDKKAAIREVEEMELNRERAKAVSLSKDEERKIKSRVRKRVAFWAKEAGII
jgi:hypothetical protein